MTEHSSRVAKTSGASWAHALWANVRWGVFWGLGLAGLFNLYVLGVYVLHGPGAFARAGVTLGRTVLVYVGGGLVAGAIVGALRPIGRHPVGAMIVGIPASFPVFAGIWLASAGLPNHWDHGTWLGLKVLPFVLGPIFGLAAWYSPNKKSQQKACG